jgi:hypothetical protein
LITLTDNLTRNGKVLLVQGTTAAGDDAAGNYLFDEQAMRNLIATVKTKAGGMRNFQVLIETTMMGGNSYSSRIIAERVSE